MLSAGVATTIVRGADPLATLQLGRLVREHAPRLGRVLEDIEAVAAPLAPTRWAPRRRGDRARPSVIVRGEKSSAAAARWGDTAMHKLRTPAQRDFGVHLARLITLSAALAAITGIVVADLTAAEADEPAAMALALTDDDAAPADRAAEGEVPVLLAAAVELPDAPIVAPPEPAPVQKKKPRKSKLSFGRFEGY